MAERTEIDAAEACGIQLANESAIKRLLQRGMSEAEAKEILQLQ